MSEGNDGRKYCLETFLIHGKPIDAAWEYSHHVIPPLTASTTFRLDSTGRGAEGFRNFAAVPGSPEAERPIYIYDRLGEPTVGLLESSFLQLEGGGSATAFASGMAAISGVLFALCRQGDEIVAHRTIYGCTYSLMINWLSRYGINVRFTDCRQPELVEQLITERTRVLYLETPANPTLDVIDLAEMAAIVARANAGRAEEDRVRLVVDNTFATPYCQRPIAAGADLVVHSLTKNVMGFGTDMGGMVVGPASLHSTIRLVRKDFGGVVAPRAAWNILVYGLSSLAVRMDRQIDTAMKVAAWLENQPQVARVMYPGLKSHPQHDVARRQMLDFKGRFAPGLMIYFELAGSDEGLAERSARFMDYVATRSYAVTLAVSLGQAKTLIEAPTLMTHSVYGDKASTAGLSISAMRLAIGLEDHEDIVADLDAALKHI
jgi:cystathionine beta-lyase/cystathionine gamma-synthase